MGLVILVLVALGVVFWPAGKEENTGASEASPSAVDPETTRQARAVDVLLNEMADSRIKLAEAVHQGNCVAAGEEVPTFQEVVQEREQQLTTAQSLDVSALDNGVELQSALSQALRASGEADRYYLKWAEGCSGADLRQGDAISRAQASPVKAEFLRLWAPIAQREGLIARDQDHI